MHAFDSAKSSHDVAYINGYISMLNKRGESIADRVDSNVEEILIGAVVSATADLAYKVAKLAIVLAKLSNPLGWLSGGSDPTEALEAAEDVARAVHQVARAAKLLDSLSDVRNQIRKIQRGLDRNARFLASVNHLVKNLNATDDNFLQQQSTFLELYGAYTPVISKPELVEVGAYLEALVTEACDIIDGTDGPPAVIALYKAYVGGSGKCWRTLIDIQTMVESYTEI